LQESTKVMESKVKLFNEKYPIGTKVIVIKDLGEQIETNVRLPARVLGGHTSRNCFEGPPPEEYLCWSDWVEDSINRGLFKGVRITSYNPPVEPTASRPELKP